MCELFAANLREPQTLNSQLSTFFGDATMHPHGWGLATREQDGSLVLHKEAQRATDSKLLANLLASPVEASHVLAHIRYATAGHISYHNTHPFVGTDNEGTNWAFIHNGSIFHQDLIRPYTCKALGQSDSERVLLYLLHSINEANNSASHDFDVRFGALSQALAALSVGNKLNVVLDDGTYTYVHTNTEDVTLFFKQTENGFLFCTRPLDNEGWRPIPSCQLLAYRNGELVQAGPGISGVYHFDRQQLDAFLLANAA